VGACSSNSCKHLILSLSNACFVCPNLQIVNSLLHIVPKNLALSYKPDILQMTAKVVDGVSGGQELTAAEKSGKPVNYGGMRLGQGGEEVRAITLDSLNLHNVSLIKVDVQGAEQLMFYGARDTIRRNMPVIAYENMENAMAQRVSTDLSLPDEVRISRLSRCQSSGQRLLPVISVYILSS